MTPANNADALDVALKEAIARYRALPEIERALVDDEHRRSFVLGQCGHDPGPSPLAEEVRRLRTRLEAAEARADAAERKLANWSVTRVRATLQDTPDADS